MKVIYRDDIGLVEVITDNETPIGFLDNMVYFTSADGTDYKLLIDNLIYISK